MKIVWDVDGPLRDTSRFKKEAMLRAAEKLGFKDYVEHYDPRTVWKSYALGQLLVGKGDWIGFEAWIGTWWGHAQHGLDIKKTLESPKAEEIVEETVIRPPWHVVKDLRNYMHERIHMGDKVEGVEKALELGTNLGIVTASKKGNIPLWLANHGLDKYFKNADIVEGVEDKAEALLSLARKHGPFIYVGDSHTDLEDVIKVSQYVPLSMVLVDGVSLKAKIDQLLKEHDFKNVVFAQHPYEGLIKWKRLYGTSMGL